MPDLAQATRNVINAAKAWHRANDANRERREKRLHQMVVRHLKQEAAVKAATKDRKAREDAAEARVWIDKEGNRTPYADLEGSHLCNIRRQLNVGAPQFDGICEEIRTRAAELEEAVSWAEGVPFVYVKTVQSGDRKKVSFRNVLTRKLQHIEISRRGFVVAWSDYMRHGLSREQACALCDAWREAASC